MGVWTIQNFPMWVVGIIAGVISGVLMFKLERVLFILATAAGGAFLFVSGLIFYLKPDLSAAANQRWLYLGILVALCLLGVLVQFAYTAPSKKKKTDAQRNLLEYEQTSTNTIGYGSNAGYNQA